MTEGNPYKQWMDDYGGEHYQNAVRVGIGNSYTVDDRSSFTHQLVVAYRNYRSFGTARPTVTRAVRGVEGSLGAVYPTREGLLGYGDQSFLNVLQCGNRDASGKFNVQVRYIES